MTRPPPRAGWYTLRYAAGPPAPPGVVIIEVRFEALDPTGGTALRFRLDEPEYLLAPEARVACALAPTLPPGLVLVYQGKTKPDAGA